jgi:hypothetical protein
MAHKDFMKDFDLKAQQRLSKINDSEIKVPDSCIGKIDNYVKLKKYAMAVEQATYDVKPDPIDLSHLIGNMRQNAQEIQQLMVEQYPTAILILTTLKNANATANKMTKGENAIYPSVFFSNKLLQNFEDFMYELMQCVMSDEQKKEIDEFEKLQEELYKIIDDTKGIDKLDEFSESFRPGPTKFVTCLRKQDIMVIEMTRKYAVILRVNVNAILKNEQMKQLPAEHMFKKYFETMAKYGESVFNLTFADSYQGDSKKPYVVIRKEVTKNYNDLSRIVNHTAFLYLPRIFWSIEHLLKKYDNIAKNCENELGPELSAPALLGKTLEEIEKTGKTGGRRKIKINY